MMEATDLFLSLTPHKVLEAVEDAGFPTNPLCYALNSFENRVYEVELDDRRRVVAKFYRPGRWSAEQILEEHTFLADLAEAEVPVCPPIELAGGGTLGRIEGIPFALFPRQGGRAPDEPDDELLERLGMLAARIHNVGAARPATQRLPLDADTFVRQNIMFLRDKQSIPSRLLGRWEKAARRIADVLDEGLSGVSLHRIHGDLHHGNLLLRDNVLRVVDFDDMVVGPAVQDLWLLLPGRGAEASRAREIFLEGYETLRAFDRRTLRLIEPLRGLRRVHYAAWIARRFHDPIFPRTFPHFGSEAYWEEETRDLEEIVQQMVEESRLFVS